MPRNEFIRWGAAICPRTVGRSHATACRIYFNTDDIDIRIDGNAIQKHAVMAIRYDKPLRDTESDLRHFGVYLITQRRRYCANGQQPLDAEENAMARRIAVDVGGQRKASRGVLHDKSSVLGHVCALISLQLQRNPQYSGISKKAQLLTIQDLVRQAGFAYGIESIRKACAKREREIAAVKLHLSKA